jgi:hypothetical protein
MDDPDPRSGSHSIGAYLATQRSLREISIEQLAAQTRIPLRSLERLESGCFDADVDGFVRGFVRTVAEALGLDPDETLNRALEEPGTRGHPRAATRLSLGRVVAALVAVALLAVLGVGLQLVAISRAGGVSTGPSASLTLRRDPIRALAEAQGVAALAGAPALAFGALQSPREGLPQAGAVKHGRAVAAPATP